jgi:hypothetical protein
LEFAKLHARKRSSQNQLAVNGDSGIDRPVPNDPFLPHSQLSTEGVSFSEPFHQGADVGLRVQGRECGGHRLQVVVGVEIPLRFPFGIVGRFRRLHENRREGGSGGHV